MKQHILTIGLNSQTTKAQVISKEDAIATIFAVVGDATISNCTGCYTHQDGTRVVENSLRVEMLFKTDEQVLEFARILKQRLDQESIVFEVKEVNSMLV